MGLFQLTFNLGEIPMQFIESVSNDLINQSKIILGDSWLSSLISDGIIAGVSSVILFYQIL